MEKPSSLMILYVALPALSNEKLYIIDGIFSLTSVEDLIF